MKKSSDALRTISEAAEILDVPKHVLRFWESKFTAIKPMKRGGGRRYYRPNDIALLRGIRHLLYGEGFTIKGVQKIIKNQGIEFVKNCGHQVTKTIGAVDHEEKPSQVNLTALNQDKMVSMTLSSQNIDKLKHILSELDACRAILKQAA